MTPILVQTLYIPPNSRNVAVYNLNPKGYLDTLCYKVDMDKVLMDGDTLSNVSVMVNDVTLNVTQIDYDTDPRGFTFLVGGGTLNTTSTLIVLVTTTKGETRSLSLALPVVVQTMEYVTSDGSPIAIVAGPSAYDVAVANGFNGSQSDWLASLTASGVSGSFVSSDNKTITVTSGLITSIVSNPSS